MIREIGSGNEDLKSAIDLVNEVFGEFVAVDYGGQGRKTFEAYLEHKYEEVNGDLLSGHKKMWGYYENGEIMGVIATRNVSHISLVFVDKNHQKKGIAKTLFNEVKRYIKSDETVKSITVNSSPYAVCVYEKLGFVATDTEKETDGIRYIPMIYSL